VVSDAQLRVPEKAALVALMTFVREASNVELAERYQFTIDKQTRDRLVDLDLITCYRGSAAGKPYVHELTDRGWRQCRAELTSPVPNGTHKAYRLLYGVLQSLDAHLHRAQLELADVFPGDESRVTETAVEAENRVRAGYQALADKPGAWVRLARLRAKLTDLTHREVDDALLRLDLHPHVFLIAESNQKILSESDREAAIRIGGEDKHLMSIDQG
jgi:hypothetical protein